MAYMCISVMCWVPHFARLPSVQHGVHCPHTLGELAGLQPIRRMGGVYAIIWLKCYRVECCERAQPGGIVCNIRV